MTEIHIRTLSDMSRVEALQEGVWLSPLTAQHHVVSGLVPEVVPKGRGILTGLPHPSNVKGASVQ